MQDVFYEESSTVSAVGAAKTKYYIIKTFSVIFYVVSVLWFFIVFMFYPFGEGNLLFNIIFAVVPFLLFLLSGIFFGRLKNRFYLDYDYTFVSGSIRFSKIIKNIKRKNIIVFDVQNIEKIGRYSSDYYLRYSSYPHIKRVVLTSNTEAVDGKDFYYMVVNSGGIKYLFILECSELFFVNILKFSNRTIFEDGFFNKR